MMIFKKFGWAALPLAIAGCSHFQSDDAAQSQAQVESSDVALALPADYRSYRPYMISDRLLQEDQIIVLYANDTARDSARADATLPDGSVIVGEIFKAKMDADGEVIESVLGRRIPGELSAIVMMERRQEYAAAYPDELKVGGWEFEVFSPAGENLGKDTTACRECHAPLGDSEYTWTIDHIAAAN